MIYMYINTDLQKSVAQRHVVEVTFAVLAHGIRFASMISVTGGISSSFHAQQRLLYCLITGFASSEAISLLRFQTVA